MKFYISNEQVDVKNQYLCNIGICYSEKNEYGYKKQFPYEIILDFGDYPIILKRSKDKDTIEKAFRKIIKKSKLFQEVKINYPKSYFD